MRRPRIIHFHFRTRHNVGDEAVVLAIRELLDEALGAARWTSVRLRALQAPPARRFHDDVNRHDLAIIGGGGLYSRWGLPLDAEALAGIRIPVVVFGAGFNRNLDDGPLSPAQIDSIHRLHAQARLASVRDARTRDMLASLGHQTEHCGDPALFLRPRQPWLPRRWQRPTLGFNVAAHGWRGQDAHLEEVIETCGGVLRSLAARHGARIVYLVHGDAELKLKARLRQAIPGARILHCAAPRLAHAYRQLDLVISMMLHSSIMAFAAGTPVINIGYDDKNRAFMHDIGRIDRHIPLATLQPEALLALAGDALAGGRDNPADRAVLDKHAGHTADFVRRIAALVNNPPAD